MKNIIKRITSAGICLLLVLASGCQPTVDGQHSTGTVDEGQENPAAVSMGRYVEQSLGLPTTGNLVTFQEIAPDTFYIWEEIEGESPDAAYTYAIWFTQDGGKNWQLQEPEWLEKLDVFHVIDVVFTAQGDAYLHYYTGNWEEGLEYHIALGSGDTLTPIEGILERIEEDYQYGMRSMYIASTGDLLTATNEGVQQWSTQPVRLVNFYEGVTAGMGSGMPNGSSITFDDTLATGNRETSEIDLYNLQTGKLERSLPIDPSDSARVLAVQQDKSALYYADNDGLYRVTMDGVINEQIIDGRMAAFGSPLVDIVQIHALSGNCFLFLLQTDMNTFELQKYYFDDSVATQPQQTLTVYSLEDNMTMRIAANAFMQTHPDILVEYRVGIEENSSVLLDDTLRTLSTEILAGNGPDVLVLDGLPVDSFIGQGVLLELSDLVAPLITDGTLLPNIISAYEMDGKLYGVPSEFTLPFIAGNDRDIPDLRSLVTYIGDKNPPTIPCYYRTSLLEYFYPMCANRWFDSQGLLNTQLFAEDLEAIKEYAELMPEDGQEIPQFNYLLGQAAWYNGGQFPFMLGKLGSMYDAAYVYDAMRGNEHATIRIFPSAEQAHFIVSAVLGINAGSKMTQAAEEFLLIALSDEVQRIEGNRFPVNAQSLRALADAKELNESIGLRNRVTFLDETSHEFIPQWFSAEAGQELMGLIESLQTTAPQKGVLQQLVVDETAAYLRGDMELTATTEQLAAKIQRYISEQEG